MQPHTDKGQFVGQTGNLIDVWVVVKRIVLRKGWKPTANSGGKMLKRDLYVMKSVKDGSVYTVVQPHHNAFKKGEEFLLSGQIAHHSVFNGHRQTHVSPYSLVLKKRK
jgi:hypothetical protein